MSWLSSPRFLQPSTGRSQPTRGTVSADLRCKQSRGRARSGSEIGKNPCLRAVLSFTRVTVSAWRMCLVNTVTIIPVGAVGRVTTSLGEYPYVLGARRLFPLQLPLSWALLWSGCQFFSISIPSQAGGFPVSP